MMQLIRQKTPLNLNLRASSKQPVQRVLALAGVAALFLLSSCLPKKQNISPRLKVVTSMPVIYDWTRNIIDENTNTTIYLSLIVKNGLNYHNYTPSDPEQTSVKEADLFIYTGGTSEQWAKQLAPENSLCLLELINSADEHIILSPETAIQVCSVICQKLCLLDPANSQTYQKNCSNYLAQLELLDNAFTLTSQKAAQTTFIICDRFPLKNIFEQYGLNYICAYDECPSAAAGNKKTDKDLALKLGKKIDELGASAVYVMEDSNKKLAKSAIGYSKNPKCDTVALDSMESTTLSQLFSGKNYINTMRSNLSQLRTK